MTRTEFKQKYFPRRTATVPWRAIDSLIEELQERIRELEVRRERTDLGYGRGGRGAEMNRCENCARLERRYVDQQERIRELEAQVVRYAQALRDIEKERANEISRANQD